MKAYINLACHGRKLTGLTMCAGTNSRIADLHRVRQDQEHIFEYLDKHCQLFDQRAVDINKIGNIVNFLAKEGIIIRQVEESIYEYITAHKKCGMYMFVDPLDDDI